MSVTIRNYRDGDLKAIVELINTADAVDQLDWGTSVTELGERFDEPGFHPRQNVFVAHPRPRGLFYFLLPRHRKRPKKVCIL